MKTMILKTVEEAKEYFGHVEFGGLYDVPFYIAINEDGNAYGNKEKILPKVGKRNAGNKKYQRHYTK